MAQQGLCRKTALEPPKKGCTGGEATSRIPLAIRVAGVGDTLSVSAQPLERRTGQTCKAGGAACSEL